MKMKAAICWEAKAPLEVEEIDLAAPKQGECLVRLAASGVCHTDAFTLSGEDPEGLFPVVRGGRGRDRPGRALAGGRRSRDSALHP
jgi:S-(hydroxymethyl)glutathione dehydrogenase/alcohol dehydrogenase